MFFKKNYETVKLKDINNLDKLNLIDVRNKEEFKSGSLKKAKNIEMMELMNKPDKYLSKDKEYHLFCLSGMRSKSVCTKLSKQGYQVVNLISVF